jgi:hypothetical protein
LYSLKVSIVDRRGAETQRSLQEKLKSLCLFQRVTYYIPLKKVCRKYKKPQRHKGREKMQKNKITFFYFLRVGRFCG